MKLFNGNVLIKHNKMTTTQVYPGSYISEGAVFSFHITLRGSEQGIMEMFITWGDGIGAPKARAKAEQEIWDQFDVDFTSMKLVERQRKELQLLTDYVAYVALAAQTGHVPVTLAQWTEEGFDQEVEVMRQIS